MDTLSVSIKMSRRLRRILDQRAKQLGYPSYSAYAKYTQIYDLMIGKPHTVTAEMARQPVVEQDAIEEEVVAMYERGEAYKGQYFERMVQEAAKEVANGEHLAEETVAQRVIKKLLGRRKNNGGSE